MKQEQRARRRKQTEVKKEIEAERNYYKETKSTLAELRLIPKRGKSRIYNVESRVSSVSRR